MTSLTWSGGHTASEVVGGKKPRQVFGAPLHVITLFQCSPQIKELLCTYHLFLKMTYFPYLFKSYT